MTMEPTLLDEDIQVGAHKIFFFKNEYDFSHGNQHLFGNSRSTKSRVTNELRTIRCDGKLVT